MTIGILALQGDVREHAAAFADLGVATRPVRRPGDLAGLAGIVLPGGESTTLSMLLASSGLFEPLAGALAEGLPAFGTCAGLLLLSRVILDGRDDQRSFGVLDCTVRRNGYGRQRYSFQSALDASALTAALDGRAASQPSPSQPVASQPGPNQPVASQPVASQPVASQPVASQPVASQPVASQPVANQPVASQPGPNQPGPNQPGPNQPGPNQPVASQPGPNQPGPDLPAAGEDGPLPAVFIRAPVVVAAGPDVEVLATLAPPPGLHAGVPTGGRPDPVVCRQGPVLASTFHPELTADRRLHLLFARMAGTLPAPR